MAEVAAFLQPVLAAEVAALRAGDAGVGGVVAFVGTVRDRQLSAGEAAVMLRDMPNDVYFKVGLIAIIGLSAKNAILIVEFAKDRVEAGASLVDGTLEAIRIRLRPIIMTSLAFMFGVLPLAISNGPGSGSQHAIGTGVIGAPYLLWLLATSNRTGRGG